MELLGGSSRPLDRFVRVQSRTTRLAKPTQDITTIWAMISEQEYKTAIDYYSRSAERGNQNAWVHLLLRHPWRWNGPQSVLQGLPVPQCKRGRHYSMGSEWVKSGLRQIGLRMVLSAHGNLWKLANLGFCSSYYHGVPQKFAKAVEYFYSLYCCLNAHQQRGENNIVGHFMVSNRKQASHQCNRHSEFRQTPKPSSTNPNHPRMKRQSMTCLSRLHPFYFQMHFGLLAVEYFSSGCWAGQCNATTRSCSLLLVWRRRRSEYLPKAKDWISKSGTGVHTRAAESAPVVP